MNLIPGWFPGFQAVAEAGASAPTALTFIDSDGDFGNPDVAVHVPAGVIEGDLLVLATFASRSGADAVLSAESGWTLAHNSTDPNDRTVFVQMKIAGPADAGAAISATNNANSSEYNVVIAFRPDVPLTGLAALDLDQEVTGSAPSSQTVLASAGPVPLVVLAVWAGGSLGDISPRGFSPAKDGELGVGNAGQSQMYFGWKVYNTAPADVTVSMQDEYAENILLSLYISCS